MASFFSRRFGFNRSRKIDIPGGLWLKCPACAEMLYQDDLIKNLQVCAACGHHFPMDREERLDMFSDPDSFLEWDEGLYSTDPLKFTGTDSYEAKLASNMEKTGHRDAVTIGRCTLNGRPIGLGVMDFKFLAASMGSVVGEKITRLIEKSTAADLPVVLVCASGGARMYEGILSLMQMAKTSGALARHAQAGLPYIPVLTHPTTAGVMASFATLGDVILAEPQALIGFAGPRVIKETTQQDLPEGFQRSEFLKDKGLIDRVVPRGELRETVANLLSFYMAAREPSGA
jgi:acetyl-CoA carboxylase carboxyl transferase subunit beta